MFWHSDPSFWIGLRLCRLMSLPAVHAHATVRNSRQIVIHILMMNLLIGILSSNYDRYEEQARALFVRERARIICTLFTRLYGRWLLPTNWETGYHAGRILGNGPFAGEFGAGRSTAYANLCVYRCLQCYIVEINDRV